MEKIKTISSGRKTRSFLRWAGSKKKLLPILLKQMDFEYNKYIEPFVGSAQLFFASKPQKAVLSDSNERLIECYKSVQKFPEVVFEHYINFPEGKEAYYQIRNDDDTNWCNEKKAAKFVYLNTFCFNGLYRTNKSGAFNVPFSNSSSKLLSLDDFNDVSHSLQNAILISGDFENIVINNCESGDFVYLDPPYAVGNKDIFKQYGPHTFGLLDLERIEKLLIKLDAQNVTFLMSYALCDESMKLANPWHSKVVSTVRNISGFAKHRKQEYEILISNKFINE